MFDRIVGIDWSGSNGEWGVAEWSREVGFVRIVHRAPNATPNWDRESIITFMSERLCSDRRTLLMIDAGFGYPTGSEDIIFHTDGWPQLLQSIGNRWANVLNEPNPPQVGTTAHYRRVAQTLNDPFCDLNEPFPFLLESTDSAWRFFVHNNVSCQRYVEQRVINAKSQFDLRSNRGAIVGGHTLSWFPALSYLRGLREAGRIGLSFDVWPHETWQVADEGVHIIAEGYPSVLPAYTSSYLATAVRLNPGDIDVKMFCRQLVSRRTADRHVYNTLWDALDEDGKSLIRAIRGADTVTDEQEQDLINRVNHELGLEDNLYDMDTALNPMARKCVSVANNQDTVLIKNRMALEHRKDCVVKCFNQHNWDAFRMVHWAKTRCENNELEDAFDLTQFELARGQIEFEGWILGMT